MAFFLAKTDPGTYSIDQFEKEQETVWDGVTNPQAVKVIRSMRPGDLVFIYHSMGQPAVVGLAQVLSPGRDDPRNPKSAVVDMRFLRRLEPPATLAEIKQCGKFDNWSLVRQSRLSTMAAPDEFVEWMSARYPGKIRAK
jgi:predicted RNA-binding protein with PUA-like domain